MTVLVKITNFKYSGNSEAQIGKYLEGKRKTREAFYQIKRQAKRNKFLGVNHRGN